MAAGRTNDANFSRDRMLAELGLLNKKHQRYIAHPLITTNPCIWHDDGASLVDCRELREQMRQGEKTTNV